jgi:hypothetical protein
MRILFIALRLGYLRNFEGPIFDLASRGHHVHLVGLEQDKKLRGVPLVEEWAAREPRISSELLLLPPPPDPAGADVQLRVRMMRDYLRYLEPVYHDADGLITRAMKPTPQGFLRLLSRPGFRLWPSRRAMGGLLALLERAAPRRVEMDAFLRAHTPDVVLFTPLLGKGFEQQELLTAAREQGLRTVCCVFSWDNLSSKPTFRTMPDLVTVWNHVQRDEAVQLHGVPRDRVAVTGAQSFDQWFDRVPSRSRETLASDVGLPADRPFLLWVCSALFRESPAEAGFVKAWIAAIRGSADPLLRSVSILIRPHPARKHEWRGVSFDGLGAVRVWGDNPVDTASKNDYFDSLYHCTAVAGLNTSALLEAAIVGRPVYTVLLPQFRQSQEGTLHFRYLLRVGGGLLHAAHDMDAHLRDLAGALRDPVASAARSQAFVEAFIRPLGRGVRATEAFTAAIEGLAARPPRPPVRPAPVRELIARRLCAWIERRAGRAAVNDWLTSAADRQRASEAEAKDDQRADRKAAERLESQRLKQEARAARRAAARQVKQEVRAHELQARRAAGK